MKFNHEKVLNILRFICLHRSVAGKCTARRTVFVVFFQSIEFSRTLVDDHIVEKVEEKGQLFKQLLKHPAIKEIRGKGLMLAVEFENFETNKKIIDACILDGVLSDWFLHCSNSMRIAPPLIITKEEIKDACKTILKNINLVAG